MTQLWFLYWGMGKMLQWAGWEWSQRVWSTSLPNDSIWIIFSSDQFGFCEHGIFAECSKKKKTHTTHRNILSLIFTTFTSSAFPLQPAKWRTTSLHNIKHYEYLLRNWDLAGFCCFNIYISISLDQKITKSAKQTNCRSQMNTTLSIIYGKVKSYNAIGK